MHVRAGEQFAARLRSFVESFDHGKWGSVCLPDFAPFFTNAAEIIDAACEEYTPVG